MTVANSAPGAVSIQRGSDHLRSLVPSALLPTNDTCTATGMARPTLYEAMAKGLFPRPVKVGGASRWPAAEVEAMCRARIAGKSEDELRALVVELTEARKRLA